MREGRAFECCAQHQADASIRMVVPDWGGDWRPYADDAKNEKQRDALRLAEGLMAQETSMRSGARNAACRGHG